MVRPPFALFPQDATESIDHHINRCAELGPLSFGEHAVFAIDRKDRFGEAAGAFLREYEVGGGEAGFEPFQPSHTVFRSAEHTIGNVAVSLRYLDSHGRQIRVGRLRGPTAAPGNR